MTEEHRIIFMKWLDGQIRDNVALIEQMRKTGMPPAVLQWYDAETAAMMTVHKRLENTEFTALAGQQEGE